MKIFVGNVDDRTTQEELSALFEAHGTVVSCAVMKQFAFVHMREEERARAAIAALNGRELNGRKMVVELSKPRPVNTWKVFVGNVSASCSAGELRAVFEAYGRVVECDIVKDYAFVHMEREAEAKQAIENLNGKELKGKRINVELSTKVQKKGSGPDGQSGDKNRRSYREDSQTRSEDYEQRRSVDSAYPSYVMASPYDQRSYLESGRYDAFENRQRPQSMYYGRDRSPMRRSPPLTGYSMPASAALAAQYRAQASGAYGSQLASAYGVQASAALASAYGAQASAALAAAYGAQAYGTPASAAYGTQSASTLANAYGTQASALAYGAQASSLAAAYGAQASAYGAQASAGGSSPYSTQSPGVASPYSSQASAALAASYRQASTPLGTYDSASQLAALAQQSAAYSAAMSQNSPTETSAYERTRLSPPRGSGLDAYRKSPELMKRFGSDRRYSESDYRRLAESQGAYRRSPPSQLEYRRPAEPHSEYANYAAAYGDYLRAAQMQSNYQRRM